jgi:hypothetical protein
MHPALTWSFVLLAVAMFFAACMRPSVDALERAAVSPAAAHFTKSTRRILPLAMV